MDQVSYRNYVTQVAQEFPDVDEEAIAKVVRHGLIMLGSFVREGHDVYINNNRKGFYAFFGKVTQGAYNRILHSRTRIRKKLRALYRLQKVPYCGYYYISLTQEQYDKHLKGEPLDSVIFYKLIEEALLHGSSVALFRCKMEEAGWYETQENYETNNAEYILPGDEDGFKSINHS